MGVALGVGAASIVGDISALITSNTTVVANNTATSVPANIETTIVSYSTGATATYITTILCSGQQYGKFRYFENVTPKIVLRGGSDRNVIFTINTPLKVPAGTTISVKVTHFNTGDLPDFECSILGYKGP